MFRVNPDYLVVQATLGQLEQQAMTDCYAGSRSRLYSLVETVSHIAPESSVVRLLQYQQSTLLHPARPGWMDRLASLLDRLYTQERRPRIRLAMRDVLGEVVTANLTLCSRLALSLSPAS